MRLVNLSVRDTLYPRGQDGTSFEKSCKSLTSWRVWCPVDIVLWVIIVSVLVLVFWKMYRSHKADRDFEFSEQHQQYSPRPKPHNNTKDLPSLPDPTDPYLVVNNLDDSLIAKDPAFKPTTLPKPARDKPSTTSQLTGLGITIGSQSLPSGMLADFSMLSSQTPINSPRTRTLDDRLGVDFGVSDVTSNLPPPVYVRNARVDS